jgi:hypothetical protein
MQREPERLIGESPNFLKVLEEVSLAAPLTRPVLVVGERGTGKELIAARLHYLSNRWEGPYLTMNCAAISETLKLESTATLDPLIGGLPLTWETNASGVFLVRNIPFNAIFKLHVHGETGEQKTITVTSRPVRGFEFKPTEDSVQTERMYGSRVRLNMGQADEK